MNRYNRYQEPAKRDRSNDVPEFVASNQGTVQFINHQLPASPDTVHWGYVSAAIEPVLTIQAGQYITIETVSGSKAKLPDKDSDFEILPEHKKIHRKHKSKLGPHILTGPIHIEGAQPGDLLCVDIFDVELRQNWGWNEIEKGAGALPKLENEHEIIHIPIDINSGMVKLPWGKKIKAKPFFGFMGVMPNPQDGELSSLIPGYFGGNMDIAAFGANCRVHFPINVAGAGFSLGDGHALQGDGEVVGTAVETALRGRIRIDVSDNCGVKFPFMTMPGRMVATAVARSIDRAISVALNEALLLLTHYYQLSKKDAYRHLSILGDVRISQLVNTAVGVYIDINTEALVPAEAS